MRSRWILILFAIGALAGVYRIRRFASERSPESLLATARETLDELDPDYESAMRQLARALALARERHDPSTEEAVLRLRAEISRRYQALPSALADYQTLLDRFARQDVEVLRDAGSTALAAGELDVASELTDRWIALEPDSGAALTQRGEVLLERGSGDLARFRAGLRNDLSPEAAEEAGRNAVRIAYLPRRSVLRAAPFGDFVASRPESVLPGQLDALERVSATLSRARDDFTGSLERAPSAYSLSFLQLLLRRGGLFEESALLGQFALGVQKFETRHEMLAETLCALVLSGRVDLARSVWRTGFDLIDRKMYFGGLPLDLVFELERSLSRIGEWRVLEKEAQGLDWLAGYNGIVHDPSYRDGFLLLSQGDTQGGLARLRTITPSSPEFFPGSTLLAYLAQDDALRPGDPESYHVWSTLTTICADLAPDDPLAPRIGRTWAKLAQLAHDAGDGERAIENLGRALSLLGEEPDLLALWSAWGQEILDQRGIDPAGVVERLRLDYKALAARVFSTYPVYAGGMEFLRQEDVTEARKAMTHVRRTLPDLPMALVASGRCELAMGNPGRAAADWARRLEVGGPGTDETLQLLSQLPWDSIPSETRLRLLRTSPDHFGPFVRLRDLAARGRVAEAIAWYERRRPESIGDAMRVEAATLYAAASQWEKVRATLAMLPEEGEAAQRTAGLFLRALVRSPGGVGTSDLARVARARPGDADLVRAVDELVSGGRASEASAVLTHLVRQAGLRRGDLAERLCALQLASTGELGSALDDQRAWIDEDGARMLELLAAFDDADPEVQLARANELAEVLKRERALQASALCQALGGRPEPAQAFLRSLLGQTYGQDEALRSQALGLLDDLLAARERGALADAPQARRFGDLLLLSLLCLERPPLASWALLRLRALPPPLRDDPRVNLLVAECLRALGASELAEALSTRLCEAGVEDAWFVREALARERLGEDAPAFRALRGQRLAAIGNRGMLPEEVALYQARAAEDAGLVDQGLALLDLSLRYLPDASGLLLERARLLEARSGPLAPLPDFHRLFATLPPERAGALVPRYLALLHAARASGELTQRALYSYVEALCATLPEEPAAVIELAWLAADQGTPSGLARAWDILDRFLRATAGGERTFRPEDDARWLDLYLRYDPERAVRFAERELFRRPELPEVWAAWTHTLHAAGRFERAFDEHALFVRFHPEPGALALVPAYASDAGRPPVDLHLLVNQTRQALTLANDGEPVPPLDHVLALAAFDRAQPLDEDALASLEAAWADPARHVERRERVRLAAATALALLQSQRQGRVGSARAVLETLRAESTEELDEHLAEVLLAIAPRSEP